MGDREYFTREEFVNMIEAYNKAEKERQELEAENNRLKAECDMYKTFYRAKHSDIKGLLLNYKQTLQEIKAIAKNAKRDICNNCGWRNTESCDPEDYTCGEFIKILQIITKAESEG